VIDGTSEFRLYKYHLDGRSPTQLLVPNLKFPIWSTTDAANGPNGRLYMMCHDDAMNSSLFYSVNFDGTEKKVIYKDTHHEILRLLLKSSFGKRYLHEG